MPPGGLCFSKSEQYAESRPREGGVFRERFWGALDTEDTRWRGPQYESEEGAGGGPLMVISEGAGLRFREKRLRREDFLLISGSGEEGCLGLEGGRGDGNGVYVCGFSINSVSGTSTSEDDVECWYSGSGVPSRSWTSWKAGRVARIAGVIKSGSDGRVLSID
jgi:hypothetical protein